MQIIGMVLDSHYPSDIRVAKEAYSLIKAGYKVHLLCTRRKRENPFEKIEGLNIHRINVSRNNLQKTFWDIILSIQFIHPLFYQRIKAFCQSNKIDILHIHDLPLSKTGILAGKEMKIPVICDFHENYPEGLRVWYKWKTNPLIKLKNSIIFSFSRWKSYEKWVTHEASHIIAVVDEMKEKLIKDFNVPYQKVTVVTNTESLDYINQSLDHNVFKNIANPFIAAYLGNVGPHRGVNTVIEGLSYLKDLNLKFVLVGSIKQNIRTVLESLIKKHDVGDLIEILGYQPFDKFYSYMSHATVNVIPHNDNGHTSNTVPHKLFQSMMAGKPVIVSSCRPLKRIVEETQSGLVFEADNPKDFARCIRELYGNKNLRTTLGENGRKHSVSGKYNWESTVPLLLNAYKKISDARMA